MDIRRDVKTFALAGFPDRPDDPAAARGDLELAPQLLRIRRQIRRDWECRAIHVSGQRYALAHACEHYGYHWLLASFGCRSIAEVRRVVAQYRQNSSLPPSRQVIRRNRAKILSELRRRRIDGDGAEQVEARAALIDQACRDHRTSTCRPNDGGAASDDAVENPPDTDIADILLKVTADNKGTAPAATLPGSIVVLRSEPQIKPKDDLSTIIVGLKKPKILAGATTLDAIDRLYSQLFEESPWLQPAIEWAWRAHRDLLGEQRTYFRLPPLLLVGPPGCGKTHLMERLANLSGVTRRRIDMASMSSSFAITGLESGWGSSRPGEVVCAIADGDAANPMIILDEIEKSRANGSAADPLLALLPLLQRDTAARFRCPALRADIDLAHVTWAMSANELGRLPAPFLDRITVFHCDAPRGPHLRHHLQQRLGDYAADNSVIDRIAHEIEAGRLTLRGLGRLEAQFRRIARGGPRLI